MSKRTVEEVKADLELRGEDLSGPCGAFKITKRVAWRLRAMGFGLLSKTAGNNCEGYATDIVVDSIGGYYDILGDGGNANVPQWPNSPEAGDFSRWRPAVDPGDPEPTPKPEPEPDPKPVPPPFDPTPLIHRIASLERIVDALQGSLDTLSGRIAQVENTPFPALEVSGSTSRTWGHAHAVNLTVNKKP